MEVHVSNRTDLADEASQRGPDIEHDRRPAGFITKSLRELGLAATGRREEQGAAGFVSGLRFALATHGPETERLEVFEAAELLE